MERLNTKSSNCSSTLIPNPSPEAGEGGEEQAPQARSGFACQVRLETKKVLLSWARSRVRVASWLPRQKVRI